MTYREEIIEAINKYCAVTGKKPTTVGHAMVGDSKFFNRIKGGGGCTVDTYQKVMGWLQENTPRGEPNQ